MKKTKIKSTLIDTQFASYDNGQLIVDSSGYHLVLDEVKSIIQAEPLREDQKDSLLTKISSLEQSMKCVLSGEEQEFQERRQGHEYDEINNDSSN